MELSLNIFLCFNQTQYYLKVPKKVHVTEIRLSGKLQNWKPRKNNKQAGAELGQAQRLLNWAWINIDDKSLTA